MPANISAEYRTNPAAVFRYDSDVANHFSAFDFDVNGTLTLREIELGFERLGNSKGSAWFKAIMARMVFETDLSQVTSPGKRLYGSDGNINMAKVDELFAKYAPNGIFTKDSAKAVVADMGFKDRLLKGRQYDSALKMQERYTKDEFVAMLDGRLMRQRILEADAALGT